ncbi:AAA family ATPase, partial [Pseudomonas fragi]|nr:AAA family ATPase [Pseudomonas sp. GC01]
EVGDLPLDIVQGQPRVALEDVPEPGAGPGLGAVEANAICAALRDTKGNIRLAAQQLQVSRAGLYNKIKRFGLSVDAYRQGAD